ncbi:MAG TPA: acyl-CoA reductase [Candidatus Binataceae bacterium]|nr:acyl-CoA reductase [Candidatus Binataceae bacterium]
MSDPVSEAAISTAISRMRARVGEAHDPLRAASVLASALERWRMRDFPARRAAVAQISAGLGFSAALLDASLDALLAPFTAEALTAFAAEAAMRREVTGFIMAGNAPGAGLHEIALSLICGADVIVKTATQEPHFFAQLARSIRECDARLGSMIEVFNWGRADHALTEALVGGANRIVAYGDDATLSAIGGGRIVGFGSRLSGAIVTHAIRADAQVRASAAALARDATLFEQLGCLSPHHVFVEDESGSAAREFAHALGGAIAALALSAAPPESLTLEDSAALRRAHETARWRAVAGEAVELIEGPRVQWAVVFDRDAAFSPSPGFRTLYVSPFRDREDLHKRLVPAAGRLEAFSLAGVTGDDALIGDLGALGVSYIAAPGAIQSPQLTWRHGGGAFLDSMTKAGAD